MGDIVVSPSERNKPQIPYGLGGVRPPTGYGPGGMLGGGVGFGGIASLLKKRFGQDAARFPGADPLPPPAGMENLTQVQGGYDPEALFNVRGRRGTASINAGFYGGGEDTYDYQGRKKGKSDPYWHEGTPGFNGGVDSERLRAMSSAAGWAGSLAPRGRGMTQGAGFGRPDDMLRRLLMARMGGGGL